MARRPGSRASRAERRMLRERAQSAIKHGLPVPVPPPSRARVPNVPPSRSPRAPSLASPEPELTNRRMPLAVKLLGGGLLLLGVIYGLTLFRDHRNSADATQPPAETDTSLAVANPAPVRATVPVGSSSVAATAAAVTTADPPLAEASSSALRVPSAPPPLPARVRAKPTVSAPIAPKKPSETSRAGAAVQPSNLAQVALPPAPVAPAPAAPAPPAPAE
jgi:pyruvate dehydrogenase E2 component (dihydrolipoamide acetyltransferase)